MSGKIDFFTTSIKEAITLLSEGVIGAAVAMITILDAGEIDPQSVFKTYSAIVSFDEYEITGSRIHILFKDICHSNPARVIAILRAVQLGFISREFLKQAIDDRDRDINVENLYRQVKTFLGEAFDKDNVAAIKTE